MNIRSQLFHSICWNTNFRFQRFLLATSRRRCCLSRSRQARGNSRSPVGQATTCGCAELRAYPTKTGKDRETSKIHWLSQLWPTAPIYCDCERNTLSDVIATSYGHDSDCGDGESAHRGDTYLTSLPLVSVRHHGRVTAKVGINFLLECKLHCPSAQFFCRQLHSTNLSWKYRG